MRVLLPCVLLALACGDAEEEAPRERPPAQVEVSAARLGSLRLQRRYLGTVRAASRAELAAGADGAIVDVNVREGDHVQRGQTLLRVDARLARASLQAAQATREAVSSSREQASREAERFARAGREVVSELEIERARSQAVTRTAENVSSSAEVARARATLARHNVVAPFDGTVTARLVDPGDWVSPGTPALEIVAEGATEIFARVEPELLSDLEVGTEATLVRGRASAQARVAGIVRALDPATRTATIRLVPVGEPPPWLLAGAAVDVVFDLEHEGEGVIVPRDALVEGVSRTRVVTIRDGAAFPIEVEVLERGLDEARVRATGDSELSEGMSVITRGNDRLRPEQPVQVMEASAAAEGTTES